MLGKNVEPEVSEGVEMIIDKCVQPAPETGIKIARIFFMIWNTLN